MNKLNSPLKGNRLIKVQVNALNLNLSLKNHPPFSRDRLIEENGVLASSDPTHLGLNDRPFVPHNLYPVIGALFLWQSSR
jgi:hypothetical protein